MQKTVVIHDYYFFFFSKYCPLPIIPNIVLYIIYLSQSKVMFYQKSVCKAK